MNTLMLTSVCVLHIGQIKLFADVATRVKLLVTADVRMVKKIQHRKTLSRVELQAGVKKI